MDNTEQIYKNDVFAKVESIFNVFVAKGLTPVRSITSDLIEIINRGASGIRAEVLCIFCACNIQNSQALQKKINVQSEVRGPNTHYWNYANLKKHIEKVHMKGVVRSDDVQSYIQSLPVIFETENVNNLPSVECTQAESQGNVKIVTPSTFTQKELYDSFSAQISSMMETIKSNNEEQKVMTFKRAANNRYGTLKIVKMPPDGNCLFFACVHQLYNIKVDSEQHKMLTSQLRGEVCQYIRSNFAYFERVIKLRLQDEKPGDFAVTQEKYETFMEDLSKSGFWGGEESLIAIAKIFSANIVVFNERGPYYLATGYNKDYPRSLFLAYRESMAFSGKRNHYDSICEIDNIVLSNCASDLCSKDFDKSEVIPID